MDHPRGGIVVSTGFGVAKRIGYGALFVAGVPALLVLWAGRSAPMIPLPAIGHLLVGGLVSVAGLVLLLAGVVALVRHGKGLPMNPFPPPRLVREGIFKWLRNPIYIGFGLTVLGTALAVRSPSGLWLVTPVTWLAMAALVFGHERHDLRRRFGDGALAPPRCSIPRPVEGSPQPIERLATLVWVFVPWLLAYFAVQGLGRPPDAVSTVLPGEERLPVCPWMELPYASAYLIVPLTVFVTRTRRALFRFALSGLLGTAVVTLCWLLIPVVAVHRPFAADTWIARLLAAEQDHSNSVAAFPAFHAVWPLLAARAWSAERGVATRALVWSWAAVVILGAVGTSHHTLLEVSAGVLLYALLREPGRVWSRVRLATERLANSWREWRLGPFRLINHGLFAGLAASLGLLLAGSTAGPGQERAAVWVAGWILVGAACYAQWLEGSSRLLRPFGWYGGLTGGILGVLASPLVGGRIMPLLAAFATAAPWIQLVGRLRCLVQGCCHGSPSPPAAGIRYWHRRSRVTQLASLAGVPLYPTPLFSIAANLVIGLLLLRLRTLAAPDSLVLGVYFMLSGCARFVEESYRGEPQTPVVGGLRVYQWFAMGTFLAGIGCTMFPMPPSGATFVPPSGTLIRWAVVLFFVCAAAMGLDVPGSNRRFSRLAAAD
jgi:protein-S-isoprenylcysteine O-methyltransferase Ste14/prolipoprotein diacylglyceryltransferase